MKNYSKHSIIAMVAVLATCLFSCTKDGDNGGSTPDTNAINKTAVAFSVSQAESGTTARVIDRGNIPYYVESLHIKAVSTAIPLPFTAEEDFTFTGSLSATFPALSLANVALGQNTFTASSTSATANKRLAFNLTNTDDLTALKAHVPYIVTTSEPVTRIITANTAPVVPLVMGTNNGRILATFGAAATEADNYKIVVSYKFGNNPDSPAPWSSPLTINPADAVNRFVAFEWSNEDAIDGARVNFKVEIYEATGTTLLRTITKNIIIQKSKSISCNYVVANSDVHGDINPGAITITFPTISEIPCPLDPEGYDCNGRDKDGRNRQGFNKCGWHQAPNAFYLATQDENLSNGGENECGN
jgi:hypothetical protein